jgi:GNAT superfamily N-acetyltransferase
MTIAVRPARDHEARACRVLMPETFSATYAPELWVAVDHSTSRIAGAAAVGWRPLPSLSGFPVQVHVLPPQRRRGIGTALIEAVAEACATSTRHLHAWANEPEGSGAARFLQAVGFEPHRRLLHFEADGPRFYATIKAIYDRVVRSGKIPSDFRVVSLREASLEETAALVAGAFRDVPVSTAMALARGLMNYDKEKSVVLLSEGAVKGALLYHWNDGLPTIDVRVVAPDLRNGPANLLLLEAATRKGLEGGATGFCFHCEESVRDTISLARRSGSKATGAKISFVRALVRA